MDAFGGTFDVRKRDTGSRPLIGRSFSFGFRFWIVFQLFDRINQKTTKGSHTFNAVVLLVDNLIFWLCNYSL